LKGRLPNGRMPGKKLGLRREEEGNGGEGEEGEQGEGGAEGREREMLS